MWVIVPFAMALAPSSRLGRYPSVWVDPVNERRSARRGIDRRDGLDLEPREERLRCAKGARFAHVAAPRELVEERRAAVAVRGVRIVVAELGERARRDRWHGRRAGERHEPNRLDEVAENARQAEPRSLGVRALTLRGLREHPRLLGLDEAVRGTDELPQRREGVVQQQGVEGSLVAGPGAL